VGVGVDIRRKKRRGGERGVGGFRLIVRLP
jgi:hypothetical protein